MTKFMISNRTDALKTDVSLLTSSIDPLQKWLPLNYSFVYIRNSLTNLVLDNKFFTIRNCLKVNTVIIAVTLVVL